MKGKIKKAQKLSSLPIPTSRRSTQAIPVASTLTTTNASPGTSAAPCKVKVLQSSCPVTPIRLLTQHAEAKNNLSAGELGAAFELQVQISASIAYSPGSLSSSTSVLMVTASNISSPHVQPCSDHDTYDLHVKHPESKGIYCFVCSLSGIIGEVTYLVADSEEDNYPPPGILSFPAEKHLKAHDYRASAVWTVIFAFRESYSVLNFVNYLSSRGMPILEAEYLYKLITGWDIWLTEPL
ncbi:hypothetical protein V8B97DRAFT_2010921 [Scleroderma yunnanense]